MTEAIAGVLLERLRAWGIDRVYGDRPAEPEPPRLSRAWPAGPPQFVEVDQEETAASMARAHARVTGRIGVCSAMSTDRAEALVRGLRGARHEGAPVVAIVGEDSAHGAGSAELVSHFREVAGEHVHVATESCGLSPLIDRAIHLATREQTVTAVIFPANLIHPTPGSGVARFPTERRGRGDRAVPGDGDLWRAASALNAGSRIAILAGTGAAGAAEALADAGDVLGAGVARTPLGNTAIDDHSPFATGPIGLLGTGPSWRLMNECDTLLVVGTRFPFSDCLCRAGAPRTIQIDRDPRASAGRPVDVRLQGDADATLRAVLPFLVRKTDRQWRRSVERNVSRWWALVDSQALQGADPVNPRRVFRELSPRLPARCLVACDPASAIGRYARDLRLRPGMTAAAPAALSSGPVVPYAVAAKFAWSDRPVVAAVGNGAGQMIGLDALATAAAHWAGWLDTRLVVLVLNARDPEPIRWTRPDFPYAAFAEHHGLDAIRIEHPGDLGAAWDRAFSASHPVLIEVTTAATVAPRSSQVTLDQARALLASAPPDGAEVLGFLGEAMQGLSGRPDWRRFVSG